MYNPTHWIGQEITLILLHNTTAPPVGFFIGYDQRAAELQLGGYGGKPPAPLCPIFCVAANYSCLNSKKLKRSQLRKQTDKT